MAINLNLSNAKYKTALIGAKDDLFRLICDDMAFSLWQLMSFVGFASASLAFIAMPTESAWIFYGKIILVLGIFLMAARYFVKPVQLRNHVPNDRRLRLIANIFGYGSPAGFLVFVGIALTVQSLVVAFIAAIFAFTVNCVLAIEIPWVADSANSP